MTAICALIMFLRCKFKFKVPRFVYIILYIMVSLLHLPYYAVLTTDFHIINMVGNLICGFAFCWLSTENLHQFFIFSAVFLANTFYRMETYEHITDEKDEKHVFFVCMGFYVAPTLIASGLVTICAVYANESQK